MNDELRTRAADPMDRLAHDENDPNPCPPLTAGEYEALKNSIRNDGFIPAFPVLISAGPAFPGRIIDGHHRSQVCAELGIQPVVLEHPCATELEFKILQIKANLERRQLSTAQRALLGARLLPLYEEQARSRMLSGKAPDPTAPVQQGTAAKAAAESAGVSERTMYQMKAVLESDQAAELLGQIEAGQKSVKRAYEALRSSVEQAALDASVAAEAQALAEIEETVALMAPGAHAEAQDGARERAVGESVRLAIELDRLLQRHALIPDEVGDYSARPHTFRGTARRLADWFASLGDVL